jgi:Presenilin
MSEEVPEKKRVTPENLVKAVLVVMAVQFVGLLITAQNLPTYQSIVNSTGYSYDPLGTTPTGSVGNAALLVVFAFALTLGLVWLLRRRMVVSFRLVVFGSVAFSAFVLTLVTADTFAFNYLPATFEVPVAFGVAGVVVVLIAYVIFVKNNVVLATVILAFVGAEVGSFFAETLDPWTALALPIAFSLYDLYAVFKGPLKQLIGTNSNVALVGMSIKAGEFTLGLGDIVFYTMLPSLALFRVANNGTVASILTILAIDAGVVVTLYLLSKKRLLPGLPIPMLLGVLTLAFFLL